MSANWYYKHHNIEKGPVSAHDLAAMERSGELTPNSLVRKSGLKAWHSWAHMAAEVHREAATFGKPMEKMASCAYSGKILPISQMVRYAPGNRWVAIEHKTALLQSLRAAPAEESDERADAPRPAGFWWRFHCTVIDISLTLSVLPLLYFAHSLLKPGFFWPLILPVLWLGYELCMAACCGRTAGQMILGVWVIRANGRPMSHARSLLRAGLKALSIVLATVLPAAVICLILLIIIAPAFRWGAPPPSAADKSKALLLMAGAALLGIAATIPVLMAGWTKRKQSLHDKLTGTLAVRSGGNLTTKNAWITKFSA